MQKEAEKEPSTLINPTKNVSGRGIVSLELHSTACPANNFFSYNLLNDLENESAARRWRSFVTGCHTTPDPSGRQCCCTSRSGAVLSYSPSQCQKKDLQNILGCISCADSDPMSPVTLIHVSREFQPRKLRLLCCISPLRAF